MAVLSFGGPPEGGAVTEGSDGQLRIERLIAAIRLAVTIGIVGVVLVPPAGGTPYYRWAVLAAIVALVYGTTAAGIVYRLRASGRGLGTAGSRSLALVDASLTLVLVALTGAGQSPLLGVAMLVTIEVAMRFSARETVALTLFVAAGLAVLLLLVPEPVTPLAERVRLALWWAGLLGWSAAMVAALARLLVEEQRQRSDLEAAQAAERNELEREREHRCRLEETALERKKFLQVLYHELRTPVASVEALSRAVAAGEDLEESHARRMLDLIQAHSAHLTGLLEELREVGTAADPQLSRRAGRTDVGVAELVHLAAHAAGVADDVLDLQIEESLEVLRVDAEKLRRVLINLLENAIRHSPADEQIGVRVQRHESSVRLVVRDLGPGVADGAAARMFGRFVSPGERTGTSGLGLWIVGELVQAMRGVVAARNHPEGGFEVVVDLPVSDVLVPPPAAASTSLEQVAL